MARRTDPWPLERPHWAERGPWLQACNEVAQHLGEPPVLHYEDLKRLVKQATEDAKRSTDG